MPSTRQEPGKVGLAHAQGQPSDYPRRRGVSGVTRDALIRLASVTSQNFRVTSQDKSGISVAPVYLRSPGTVAGLSL